MKIIKQNKIKTNGSTAAKSWALMGLFLLLLIQTPNTAAEPPIDSNKECIAYGYSKSFNHYFLINDDALIFGQNVTINHNCERLEVKVNDSALIYDESGSFEMRFQSGTYNLTFTNNENYSINYSNVEFLPDRLEWEFEFLEWENQQNDYSFDEFILRSKATAAQNWASILSIVMVFTLTTMVYWNLINSYVDRNFCEEVKE